jgi:hypothetical protein
MKKLLSKPLYALLCTVLIFTSCGQGNPGNPVGDEPAAPMPPDTTPEPPMTVVWGWGHLTNGMEIDLADAPIPQYFSERYGVQIEMKVVAPEAQPEDITADIFIAYAADAYKSEAIRTIPRDLIERHAPQYARLLDTEPYVADLNKVPGTEEYMGLLMYNGETHALNNFSVYRLDWLEDVGIVPNGTVTQLFDRVYFTDQAFDQSQFIEIITAFTDQKEARGFYLPQEAYAINDFLAPLAGMYGLNMTSWFDGADGAPIAGEAYRELLHFLRYINEAGLSETGSIEGEGAAIDAFLHAPILGRVGWWTAQTLALGYYRAHDSHGYVLSYDPSARLLIAPPEIGLSGQQGVGINSVLPVFFGNILQWVVHKDVTDEKLAVILGMFDDLSFNPESWVIAMHGFEGTNFEWEGEPYASRVVQSGEQYLVAFMNYGTMSLHTNVYDGKAGTTRYSLGDNALTRFAQSMEARRMIITPTRHDPTGAFSAQTDALNAAYWEGILDIVQAFYWDAVSGAINIDTEWAAYLDRLNENGLPEYVDLISQFPRVGE